MDLLRDGIWQSIGVILGAGISVIVFLYQRQVKKLGYSVTNISSLLTTNVQGNLKLVFDGKELSNPYLAFIRIQNQGNAPIPKTDYDQPLILDTGDLVTVIAAGVVEEHARKLGASVENINGSKIQLSSVLLNPGDCYDIQLILDPTDPLGIGVIETQARGNFVAEVKQMINLTGRIVGVKEIDRGLRFGFWRSRRVIALLLSIPIVIIASMSIVDLLTFIVVLLAIGALALGIFQIYARRGAY